MRTCAFWRHNFSNHQTPKISHFRHHSYIHDQETDLYYLQSRYYDPGMGRFINADTLIVEPGDALTAHNLFAYCFNDPINKTDQQGTWPSWAKKLAAAVAVVAVVAVVAAVTVATAGTGAAITCAAMGAAKGAAIGFVSGAISGAASGAVTHRIKTGRWDGAGEAALNGMADGALSGAISGAVTGAFTSPYCFVAGTAVLVASGTAAIETIQAGDLVWAWDEETGEVALKEVVETYVNETDELVHVFVNGEEIVTTPSHPFYSPVKGWTDAVHLRAGDILVLVNGEYVVVEKVQHEILEAPVTVYNFQVEDYHTYYVACGILVHNRCHGNSLKSQKTNYGYQLQDSQGNILKYGETIHPNTRYSKAWLNKNGYSMKIMTSGSKQSVHAWQHQKILDYTYVAGHRPPLNKSFW